MSKQEVLKVTDDVHWIGVQDNDIVTFDVVMETKYGTTYNSYFIDAEKKAVVETVKEKFWPEFEAKLRSLVDPTELEYIILNHTEPDHSGSLGYLLDIAPGAVVVGSGNAIRYLRDIIGRDFPHQIVKDGDTLSLGNRQLSFISAPNLHWPDTMFTWMEEEGVLFTCDAFGAHYASEEMFDDLVDSRVFDEAFQYYFNVILRPFSRFMIKAIEKIRPLNINVICTGHGPILRTNWKKYVDLSLKWSEEYLVKPERLKVFIPYVSAYHKTGLIAEEIAKGISENSNIDVEVLDIETSAIGELEEKVGAANGIIVGSPVINQNILLPVYKLFAVITPLRDKGKLAGGFGSYGWSGENEKLIRSALENLKLNYHEEGVFFKFTPDPEQLRIAREYGKSFALRLIETNK